MRSRRRLLISLIVVAFLPFPLRCYREVRADARTPLDLKPYRGSVVYVDFWASWCVPCRKSFPWLNAMQDKYGDKGLAVHVLDSTDPAAVAAFDAP